MNGPRRIAGLWLCALALCIASCAAAEAGDLVLYGAGSLKGAVTEIAAQFDQRFGTTTRVSFGPSGMMRERIEKTCGHLHLG